MLPLHKPLSFAESKNKILNGVKTVLTNILYYLSFNRNKTVTIISDKSQEIADRIMKEIVGIFDSVG